MRIQDPLILICVLCGISIGGMAGTPHDLSIDSLQKQFDTISTTTAAGSLGITTAVSRPDPQGAGCFLFLDVLYWQTKLQGTEYAATITSFSENIMRDTSLRIVHFKWDFGVKAGLGYRFAKDGWDVFAEYTYFLNRGNDTCNVNLPSVLVPVDPSILSVTASNLTNLLETFGSTFATQSSSNMKVRLDDLILNMGRGFFISSNLALRPNIGLKTSWLTLDTHTRFSGGGEAFSLSVNDFPVVMQGLGQESIYVESKESLLGIGPKIGLDTSWYLGKSISVYGDLNTALLFGYFKTQFNCTYSAFPNNYLSSHDKFHKLVPFISFRLGLMYNSYIRCNTQHVAFSLGYDNQYYWDVSYINNQLLGGGMGMYGVSLKVRWDF